MNHLFFVQAGSADTFQLALEQAVLKIAEEKGYISDIKPVGVAGPFINFAVILIYHIPKI